MPRDENKVKANIVADVDESKHDENTYEHDKEIRNWKCKLSGLKERAQIMVDNPGVAARVFNLLVHAFACILLGINLDSTTRTSNYAHKKGLFGWSLAWYAVIEAQGRGGFHIHGLLWLIFCSRTLKLWSENDHRAMIF